MSNIDEQIRNAAKRNIELLDVLVGTDYAIPDLEQQNISIQNLEKALGLSKDKRSKLSASTEKVAKEQRAHSASGLKLTQMFGGKFAKKAEQLEMAVMEALRAEHHNREEIRRIEGQLKEVREIKQGLEPDATRNIEAQKELDALYKTVFAGETPAFPKGDLQENAVEAFLKEYQRLEGIFKGEQKVSSLLEEQQNAVKQCAAHIDKALHNESCSITEMFRRYGVRRNIGEPAPDGAEASGRYRGPYYLEEPYSRPWAPHVTERSAPERAGITKGYGETALDRADSAFVKVYQVHKQVKKLRPEIQPLPKFFNPEKRLLPGDFLENVSKNHELHQKMQKLTDELKRAADQLDPERKGKEMGMQELKGEISSSKSKLEEARKQLQKLREEIFESLSQKLPEYSEKM